MTPQASDALRAEWKSDGQALAYLDSKGIHEVKNGIFILPDDMNSWDEKTYRAVQYLCDEWDFACLNKEDLA